MRENRTYGSVRGGGSNADRLLDCDLSAGTEVSGKGDASSITLFLSSAQAHRCITLSGNPKAVNLGGPGAGPR